MFLSRTKAMVGKESDEDQLAPGRSLKGKIAAMAIFDFPSTIPNQLSFLFPLLLIVCVFSPSSPFRPYLPEKEHI
jgi:hypothetical protein